MSSSDSDPGSRDHVRRQRLHRISSCSDAAMTDGANAKAAALLKRLKGKRLTDRQCEAVIKIVADAHAARDKPAYDPGKELRTELIENAARCPKRPQNP